MKTRFTTLLSGLLLLTGCGGPAVQQVVFPQGATPEEKVRIASELIPSAQQLAWQQLELTAFLHFGINTFTDREWGDGTEDPDLFNPTAFDPEQWISTLRQAGFRMVILTAKHHDGFCLWPTATTGHSVAASAWMDGKGDVVAALREACDAQGMRFGVYLSPWDRNAACYGDSPRYNDLFVAQLTELLTRYGQVDEVWFDGACAEGPNGRRQEYDWQRFYRVIDSLQPQAVTAIMGDDIRWVGNERGLGRDTEWSVTAYVPPGYPGAKAKNDALGLVETSDDMGSRELIARAGEAHWYPSEVDVSIRPGWFYHAAEDYRVKSLKELAHIYNRSVGCNSVLLLNIPPDRRGRIHPADSTRLQQFGHYLRNTFGSNLLEGSPKLWKAEPGDSRTYRLTADADLIMLQEDIAQGQRVEAFAVEVLRNGDWQQAATGTTVGYKRILPVEGLKAGDQLRIRLLASRGKARICNVAAYRAQPIAEEDIPSGLELLPREQLRTAGTAPLVLDLGGATAVSGLIYAPDLSSAPAFRYTVSVSNDGRRWSLVAVPGEFGNIMHNPAPQAVTFAAPVTARYLRLEATTAEGQPAAVGAEEVQIFR